MRPIFYEKFNKTIKIALAFCLSPTWLVADWLKKKYCKYTIIRSLNSLYLWNSVFSIIGIVVFQFSVALDDAMYLYLFLPVYMSTVSLCLFITACFYNSCRRIRVYRWLDCGLFYLSAFLILSILLFSICYQERLKFEKNVSLSSEITYCVYLLWSWYLLSRCNEIFFSFLRDAFDKLGKTGKVVCPDEPKKKRKFKGRLTFKERIALALKSYLELVINFAILYTLLGSKEFWAKYDAPYHIMEALYFSGATITTVGYGDYSPKHWWPQLLAVYEVFCGFTLLVVCFTIYSSLALKDQEKYLLKKTCG